MNPRRLLWIPHAPWPRLDGQRQVPMIRRLSEHFAIHVATWEYNSSHRKSAFLRPSYYRRSLESASWTKGPLHFHRIPVVPNLANFLARDKVKSFFPNRLLYRRRIRELHARHGFDLIVFGTNQWMFGDPPRLEGVRYVFDYLDSFHDWQLESIARLSNGVMCVSHFLERQMKRFHGNVLYSPNGVELGRYRGGDSAAAKKLLGFEGRKVVSIIGLTCSPRLYFVDALAQVQKTSPEVLFLFVGGGPMKDAIRKRCERLGVDYSAPGQVPHSEIAEYFAASDVGLYPNERSHVFDGACPLKILEYTAAGKPVVSSPSAEVEELGFRNVLICEPEAGALAAAVERALHHDGGCDRIDAFDWDRIAREARDFLDSILGAPA